MIVNITTDGIHVLPNPSSILTVYKTPSGVLIQCPTNKETIILA